MQNRLPLYILIVMGIGITSFTLFATTPRVHEVKSEQVLAVMSSPILSMPQVLSQPFAAIIQLPSLTMSVHSEAPKPVNAKLPSTSAKPNPPKPQSSTPPPAPQPTPSPAPTGPGQVGANCPVSTQNCVPCNAGEAYCRVEAGKSTGFKGWACQNNNPGNIRYSEARNNLIAGQGGVRSCGQRNGYMVFKDYTTGRNSLKAYIKAINAGQHSSYASCGDCTLVYFFNLYAPSSDGNNPNAYANTVGNAIGVDANTVKLNWVVNNKFDAFLNAIQTHEGWFVR